MSCIACFDTTEQLLKLNCGHEFCNECLLKYVECKIKDRRTDIECMSCNVKIKHSELEKILSGNVELVAKYDEFLFYKYLLKDPYCRWCPAPNCGYAVIGDKVCTKLNCEREGCGTKFCYVCRDVWVEDNHRCVPKRYMNCPRCSCGVIKNGGCNILECPICNIHFCWLCREEVTGELQHFFAPNGCSAYGVRRMRGVRRRIVQILLMMLGPLLIPVLAVLTIPAVVVVFPIHVGLEEWRDLRAARHRCWEAFSIAMFTFIIGLFTVSFIVLAVVVCLIVYVYGLIPYRMYMDMNKEDDGVDLEMGQSGLRHEMEGAVERMLAYL